MSRRTFPSSASENPVDSAVNGSNGEPTLRFFYSPRSGPSRRVEAFLAQVLQRRQNHRAISFQRVNCDDHPDLAERFAVTKLPTLIVVDRHKVRGRLESPRGCREIEQFLEPWLKHKGNGVGPVEQHLGNAEGLDRPLFDSGPRSSYKRVGLQLPANLSFDRWRAFGQRLGGLANASTWWLGDWAAYGERRFGERYTAAMAVTGFDYQTLRNYAYIARRFDVSRRRDTLSFAHHAEVAALPASEQEEWLDRAEQNGWSRNELRTRLRDEKRRRKAPRVEFLRFGVDRRRAERWRKAAEASGLELTDWLVAVADEAAADGDRRSSQAQAV
jgi:Thioredoxin